MTDQFTVGQWVRVTGPDTDPDQGRVAQIRARRFASYMVRFTDGRQQDYEVSAAETDFEKWEPRPGECVRITKCEVRPDAVGFVGAYAAGPVPYIRVEDTPNPPLGWQLLPGDAEFEPVFETAETDESERLVLGQMGERKFSSGFVEPGSHIVTRSLKGPDEWTQPTEWIATGAALDDLATHLGLPRRDDGETDASYRERLSAFVAAFNATTLPGQVVRLKRPDFTQRERTEYDRPSPTLRAEKRMADVREVLGGQVGKEEAMRHMSRDDAAAAVEQFEARRLVENSNRREKLRLLMNGLIAETLALACIVALYASSVIAGKTLAQILIGWWFAKLVARYVAGRVAR